MQKIFKILLSIILSVIAMVFILLGTYIFVNIQGVIEPFKVGSPEAENKILIASQGSDFKDNLLEMLVQELKGENKYLYVVDCTKLGNEVFSDWDVIVIIHSAQIHKMPREAELFLKRSIDLSKVILVTTSGAGDEKIEVFEVDAISTASRISKIYKVINWLIPKVESRLMKNIE